MTEYNRKRAIVALVATISLSVIFIHIVIGFPYSSWILSRLPTEFEAMILWYLVSFFVIFGAMIYASLDRYEVDSQESKEESDKTRVIDRIAKEKLLIIFIIVLAVPMGFNYLPADSQTGGTLECHEENMNEGNVVEFSRLNGIDQKVFRMTINESYLTQSHDNVNKDEEGFALIVKGDYNNDLIYIYNEGRNSTTEYVAPKGLSDNPKMDISNSEYFDQGVDSSTSIEYKNRTYTCRVNEFTGFPGA